MLKNMKQYIAAKESAAEFAPPAEEGNYEDFGVEEESKKKVDSDEYDLGAGGLDAAFGDLRRGRASVAIAAPAYRETEADLFQRRQTIGAVNRYATTISPALPPAPEEAGEFPMFDQPSAQGKPSSEFEQLFGGVDRPRGNITRSSMPTPPGVLERPKPQTQETYNQFANYYTTYKQPAGRASEVPQRVYGRATSYPQPPSGANPFDATESKYMQQNQGNEYWPQ